MAFAIGSVKSGMTHSSVGTDWSKARRVDHSADKGRANRERHLGERAEDEAVEQAAVARLRAVLHQRKAAAATDRPQGARPETRQSAADCGKNMDPQDKAGFADQTYVVQGKYNNLIHYVAAWTNRQILRRKLRRLITWPPKAPTAEGCTAIIGMCHRLPEVLLGNLRCLAAARWSGLREIIVVVDAAKGAIDSELERRSVELCDPLPIRFLYYSPKLAAVSEDLKLPYVFAWLSWSIGIAHSQTRHVLLHDYDALVLDRSLERRYQEFTSKSAFIQGIAWYKGNGIKQSDALATTFEAFVDAAQLIESTDPIDAFHQIGRIHDRTCDFDILLKIQHERVAPSKRLRSPMGPDALVHPAQMIHQYTMARKQPGQANHCYSLPMIPFFGWLSGQRNSLARAREAFDASTGRRVHLFGDLAAVNFAWLDRAHVDWLIKQMVQVCVALGEPPSVDLFAYSEALHRSIEGREGAIWGGDFTPPQKDWLEQASAL